MLKKLFFALFTFVAVMAAVAGCGIFLLGNIEADGGKTFLKAWTVISDGVRAAETEWNNVDWGVRALVANIGERRQQGEAEALSDRPDDAQKRSAPHRGKHHG